MADTVTQDQVSDEDVYARVCIGCRKRLDPHEYTKEFFKCDSCLKPVEEDVAATKSLWGLGDLGNEQPAWPDEGYAEYCPASSHLSSYNRFREFTMGATGISEEDYETLECDEGEPVVMHTKVYLLTERLDDIRLYIRRRGNEERLVGLLVGSGDSRIPIGIASAREDVKGGIDEDGYDDDDPTRRVKPVQEDEGNLSFGKRRASLLKVEESPGTEMTDFPPDREESLELSDKSPYLKKITIQQTVWGKEREKLQKRIVYLCLEDMEGKTLSYGHKMRPKAEAGEIVYPPEVAEGVLAVVGVGMCDWHPLSLQVVDLSAASDPTSDDAGETVFYGGSRLNNVVITDDMDRYCGLALRWLRRSCGVRERKSSGVSDSSGTPRTRCEMLSTTLVGPSSSRVHAANQRHNLVVKLGHNHHCMHAPASQHSGGVQELPYPCVS